MNSELVITKMMPLFRKHWLPIILASFGLICFIYGLIVLFDSNTKQDLEFSQTSQEASMASKSQNFIVIDIEGAVVKPGVYKLTQGSIFQDALIAAKGLSEIADREYLAKYVNLASKLSDGQKIYIQAVNEVSKQVQGVVSESTTGLHELININMASVSQLDSLSGIGVLTAQKIIDNRPYLNINELLTKKVVSNSVFTKIKDKITSY